MTDETWKPVPGASRYEVSDRGRLRDLRTGKQHATFLKNDRRACTLIMDDGRRRCTTVSRLVVLAHRPPPHERWQVRHLGDPTDDSLENLVAAEVRPARPKSKSKKPRKSSKPARSPAPPRHARPAASSDDSRRKPRRCLRCGTTFDSAHAGNRLCEPCRSGADTYYAGWCDAPGRASEMRLTDMNSRTPLRWGRGVRT